MLDVQTVISTRAKVLAERILQGAAALEQYSKCLSGTDWQTPVAGDGRSVGVVVHHVASSYPVEIELALMLVSGQPISDMTMTVVDQMNAEHALQNAATGQQETLALLRRNSRAAAEAVRALTDNDLENSATVSLNADAPLTAQFFIEDHALRHSYHHLARIKATLSH